MPHQRRKQSSKRSTPKSAPPGGDAVTSEELSLPPTLVSTLLKEGGNGGSVLVPPPATVGTPLSSEFSGMMPCVRTGSPPLPPPAHPPPATASQMLTLLPTPSVASEGAAAVHRHASAPAASALAGPHAGMGFSVTMASHIRDLHDLHCQGLLTKEEFEVAKHHVLHEGSTRSSSTGRRSRRGRRSSHSSRSSRKGSSRRSRHSSRSSSSSSSSSSRSSSSSSKSSKSSSSSKHFMIPLRTGVWGGASGPGNTATGSSFGTSLPSNDGSETNQEFSAGEGAALGGAAGVAVVLRDVSEGELPVAETVPLTIDSERVRSPTTAGTGGAKGTRRTTLVSAGTGAVDKYGTFQEAQRKAAASSVRNKLGPRLLNQRDVNVKYFNSRGRSGETYAAVQLRDDELRDPIVQHSGGMAAQSSARCDEIQSAPGSQSVSRQRSVADLTADERRLYEGLHSGRHSDRTGRSGSSHSVSSCVELHLNWYFVEVIGRDEHNHRRSYERVLKRLTKEFNICPTFLVEREHTLVLPQILESPEHPGQFLICLRVATEKISTTDDNIVELTNRWLIVVDLHQKCVIVLNRLDCSSLAQLRLHWSEIMSKNDISFEEFLLKLLDEAVGTYTTSLDAHASLLDICEGKLLLTNKATVEGNVDGKSTKSGGVGGSPLESHADAHSELNRQTYERVYNHFDNASRSAFLSQLLNTRKVAIDKSEMNSFLYHLHRRSSVQHRVLLLTQVVLTKCFTKLRLCSKQHATQMGSYCIELAAKAQEIRDDSQHLLDMHISLQSFRTNELMAVLTRLTGIFTPMSFLAGVYGMNFVWIPEIHFTYGYYVFWGVCILVAIAIHLFFVRKGLF